METDTSEVPVVTEIAMTSSPASLDKILAPPKSIISLTELTLCVCSYHYELWDPEIDSNGTDSNDTNCINTANVNEHAEPYAIAAKLSENRKLSTMLC